MDFNIIDIGLLLSVFLFFFYETEGWVEWIYFLKLNYILPYSEEYKNIINSGGYVRYLTFVKNYDNSFFIKLFACPICSSFWYSLFFCLIVGFKYYPFINFFGLFGYFVLKIIKNYSEKV